jgi:hypothetical protein
MERQRVRIFLGLLSLVMVFQISCAKSAGDDDSAARDDTATDDSIADDTVADDSIQDDSVDDTQCDDDVPSPNELAPIPSDAVGVFVSVNGDDANPGTMAAPLRTITAGINSAQAQQKSAFIAQGEYEETLYPTVSLFGGYEDACWTRSIDTYRTIIYGTETETYTIHVIDQETAIILEGLGVNGWFYPDENPNSGVDGVYIHQSNAIINKNHIMGSNGVCSGIALNIWSPEISEYSSLVMNNLIIGSSTNDGCEDAYVWGVEISREALVIMINNIVIAHLTASGNGAASVEATGIWAMELSYLRASNNFIFGGFIPSGKSIGIECGLTEKGFANYYLTNNIIYGAIGSTKSIGIDIVGVFVNGLANNNLIAANPLNCAVQHEYGLLPLRICYPDFQFLQGSNNFVADPGLVDLMAGDYHLAAGSPAIDAGTTPDYDASNPLNSFLTFDPVSLDFDGNPRPVGSTWDIGPYEWAP